MPGNFGLSGYLVLVIYMLATILLGLSFARKQKNLAGYFLAERAAPWWAVGISVIACDLSAISYMGSPGWVYDQDLRYPMSTLMLPFMAWLVAYLFIPFLAKLQVYTIYEYLEHRFGLSCRLFASAIFSLQRAAHLAVAIFAVSLAFRQIAGWDVWACIIVIGALTTFYTVFGGMKAVLWTDVMQFFVLVGGIFVMLGVVLWQFDGNVVTIWRSADSGGHTKLFTFDTEFWRPQFWQEMTIWGIFLGMLVTQVAAYGSDQVLVQRYISAGSGKMMTRSLMFSAFLAIPVMVLLNFLGLGFYAYYHAPGNSELLASLNNMVSQSKENVQNLVMPHFIRSVLPSGLAGLVFAGLFAATMSVFSSGLNSLSTVTCVDFVQRIRRLQANSKAVTLENARWVTFVWGLVVTLAAIGVYSANLGSVVEIAVSVIGFFSGPLLGMFLLGMFSMRANSTGTILGALAGFATAWYLGANYVSFIWNAFTGCVPTVVFGYLFSCFFPAEARERVFPMTIWGRKQRRSTSGSDG
ncbi:MAG: sodium/solute symporter [Pirellulales bacterium]|nr:sodium/solute symporter [Pirellulales bacterium]